VTGLRVDGQVLLGAQERGWLVGFVGANEKCGEDVSGDELEGLSVVGSHVPGPGVEGPEV